MVWSTKSKFLSVRPDGLYAVCPTSNWTVLSTGADYPNPPPIFYIPLQKLFGEIFLEAGAYSRGGLSFCKISVFRSIFALKKDGFPISQSGLYVDVVIIAFASVMFSWQKSLLAFLALLIPGMNADFALGQQNQVSILMGSRVGLVGKSSD